MAQLTKAAFLSKWAALFADNSTRDISEEDLRDFREDISDSFLSLEDNFIDEDDMASDSDTKVPTQQSVKAYVDARVGSAGAWQKVTIPVSSAEILALNTTPKRLIDNPGAGNGIIVDAVIFRKTGPTTAYATNTTMRVYLGSGATPVIDDVSDFLTESGARVQYSRSNSYGNTTVSGNHINLTVNTGNPTDGDGDIEVDVIYMIVDTAGI